MPDWVFGIWIEDQTVEIFGEHIWLIDKFKPTRGYFNAKPQDLAFVMDLFQSMKQFPKLHFVKSSTMENQRSGQLNQTIECLTEQQSEEEYIQQMYQAFIRNHPDMSSKTIYDPELRDYLFS